MLRAMKPINLGFIFAYKIIKGMIMNNEYLSKYFKRREFACKDGCGLGLNDNDVHPDLIEVLEEVREYFGKPVVINSGLRCETHNRRVGGAPRSQHLLGTAADIRVQGVEPSDVHKYLTEKYPDEYGIGKYKTFTHIDVRDYKARF